MQMLLKRLNHLYPAIRFEAGEAFFWSPKTATVTYPITDKTEDHHQWALLHEVSHALLGHNGYEHDVELLLLEVAAWQKAKELARELDITIEEDHIQDCLDTYRDWLHQRSTCPRCSTVSLQVSTHEYRCHNCLAQWHVSASRFCRPYRLSKALNKKPPVLPQATFQ